MNASMNAKRFLLLPVLQFDGVKGEILLNVRENSLKELLGSY